MTDFQVLLMTDSSSSCRDKTSRVMEHIESWKEHKVKGSMVLHFDGSGRIARFQLTVEGH